VSDLSSIVAGALGLAGALLVLVAAIGIVRMPDLPTRMHASSKAGTLGVIVLIAASAVHFGGVAVAVKAALIAAFLMLGAPVAAHVIARAAYRSGVPLADDTVVDDLAADLRSSGDRGTSGSSGRGPRPG
jgi:multicomponent Na+:H+ antiporter subunit G